MGSEEFGSIMDTDTISENVAEMSMFNYGWDANFSGGQSGNNYLGSSTMVHDHNEFAANPQYQVVLENQTTPFTSDSSVLVDTVPMIPSFETGNFSGDGASGCLLNGKSKRKSVEVEKHKHHQNIISNSRKQGKTAGCDDVDPCKGDYILVRAKRGQATNSHSLAERVRREKISERMKLLQDLVPGCNKISGKAVMLDEIINYVQSLQQQVEFLSMKLSTVNPDINVDIERLLSKDLHLHPQGGNAIDQGLSSSHAFLPGIPHGPINSFQGAAPPFHPLTSNLWNNELQSVLQMGFDSNPPPLSSFGANGLSKME